MLNLRSRYEWLNACTGIELHARGDETYLLTHCSVSVRGQQLDIQAKGELSGSLAGILEKLPGELPVAISLTGKGVLTKRSPIMEQVTADNLNHVFPNIKAEQFYVQNFISGEYSYISIIRREIVDELLEKISKAGSSVLMISLGAFPVSHVLGQFNTYGSELVFDGHYINYTKELAWKDYQYKPGVTSEFPIKIDNEIIADKFVLPYAVAFQLALCDYLKPIQLAVEDMALALSEYKGARKFKHRLTLSLGAFFILLLINFFVYSYVNSENETLIARASQSSAGVENIRKLLDEVNSKEQMLTKLGWYKGMSHAWICDQVAQTVPPSILLDKLSINPRISKNSSIERKDTYDMGRIRVYATTTDLGDVNEWIYRLKERSWINQVVLNNYKPSQNDGLQELVILISY